MTHHLHAKYTPRISSLAYCSGNVYPAHHFTGLLSWQSCSCFLPSQFSMSIRMRDTLSVQSCTLSSCIMEWVRSLAKVQLDKGGGANA